MENNSDNYSHLNNYLIEFYVKESSNAYKDTNHLMMSS